jgi:hypothetical protein
MSGRSALQRRSGGTRNSLLVEGSDDEHVFYSLLQHYDIPDQFKIVVADGIEQLKDGFAAALVSSEIKLLGVVVDADSDLEARWHSLRNILIAEGYTTTPTTPYPNGTIVKQPGKMAVGIWLMPDNVVPGMIEDFIKFLVPENDVLWPLAEGIVQKVIETDCKFRPSYRSKAFLHTWLAWQEEPGRPMGQAITKKYLNANASYAQMFIAWIRELFELEIP